MHIAHKRILFTSERNHHGASLSIAVHIVTTIGGETGLFLFSNATHALRTRRTPTRTRTSLVASYPGVREEDRTPGYEANVLVAIHVLVHTTCEKNIARRFCACVIVELEYEYIRNVNVLTDRQTEKILVDLIMWVSLRLAPIKRIPACSLPL